MRLKLASTVRRVASAVDVEAATVAAAAATVEATVAATAAVTAVGSVVAVVAVVVVVVDVDVAQNNSLHPVSLPLPATRGELHVGQVDVNAWVVADGKERVEVLRLYTVDLLPAVDTEVQACAVH